MGLLFVVTILSFLTTGACSAEGTGNNSGKRKSSTHSSYNSSVTTTNEINSWSSSTTNFTRATTDCSTVRRSTTHNVTPTNIPPSVAFTSETKQRLITNVTTVTSSEVPDDKTSRPTTSGSPSEGFENTPHPLLIGILAVGVGLFILIALAIIIVLCKNFKRGIHQGVDWEDEGYMGVSERGSPLRKSKVKGQSHQGVFTNQTYENEIAIGIRGLSHSVRNFSPVVPPRPAEVIKKTSDGYVEYNPKEERVTAHVYYSADDLGPGQGRLSRPAAGDEELDTTKPYEEIGDIVGKRAVIGPCSPDVSPGKPLLGTSQASCRDVDSPGTALQLQPPCTSPSHDLSSQGRPVSGDYVDVDSPGTALGLSPDSPIASLSPCDQFDGGEVDGNRLDLNGDSPSHPPSIQGRPLSGDYVDVDSPGAALEPSPDSPISSQSHHDQSDGGEVDGNRLDHQELLPSGNSPNQELSLQGRPSSADGVNVNSTGAALEPPYPDSLVSSWSPRDESDDGIEIDVDSTGMLQQVSQVTESDNTVGIGDIPSDQPSAHRDSVSLSIPSPTLDSVGELSIDTAQNGEGRSEHVNCTSTELQPHFGATSADVTGSSFMDESDSHNVAYTVE